MALGYDVCVYILYDHPGFFSATEWSGPYRDFAEIVRKTHSHSAIFTISVILGLPTIISRAYDHFWGPNDYLNYFGVLTISVRCLYQDRSIILRYIYKLRAWDC